MKILVVGSGGREHAIIRALKKSPKAETIYALPGNGGIAADAICVEGSATDIDRVVGFSKDNGIDFVVVAPDNPLVLGMVDALNEAGIATFGPRANAAILEGSKVFSKNLMKKYGIPTARSSSPRTLPKPRTQSSLSWRTRHSAPAATTLLWNSSWRA